MSQAPFQPICTRVLVVDDDPIVLESVCELLVAHGCECVMADCLASCDSVLLTHSVDVVLLDASLPDGSGVDHVRRVLEACSSACVIVMTGYGTLHAAVNAMRAGASDFLTKPVVDRELLQSIDRAMTGRRLKGYRPARHPADTGTLDSVLGSDPRMLRVREMVEAVAPTKATVLMTGESGVGKSMIARAIHEHSSRSESPFIELSCGSIPETLLESELFGYVKGAFTGAYTDKAGRFLAANHGTVFLDEINSASPAMQLKLLRVLQEKKFEPVGSSETIEVDVRVVLATNQALDRLVASGQFRQDLYYRINVVDIELPPLRERRQDIATMALAFLDRQSVELGKQIVGITDDAIEALCAYDFPGNVRELENVIARAAVLTTQHRLTVDDLPDAVRSSQRALPDRNEQRHERTDEAHPCRQWTGRSLEASLAEMEVEILRGALDSNGWNRTRTADALGINRATLYKKMKHFGIAEPIQRRAG